MVKIIVTICYILKLKCTKFDFSAPDFAGKLTVLPQLLSWIQGKG